MSWIQRCNRLGASTAIAVALILGAGGSASAVPPTPNFGGAPVEGYASQAPISCISADPHRPGVERTMQMLLAAYPNSRPGATWAACGSRPANSDHFTGRALDWHPDRFGVEPPVWAKADGDEVANWLLETVNGVPHMRLRRLGIVYIIWHNRIWTTSTQEWRQYQACSGTTGNVTTCHRDHVHLSFGVAGADGLTSWGL